MGLPAVVLALFSAATLPDVRDLLERSRAADDRNAEVERNYIFQQRTETRTGKSVKVETFDTILSGGKPYQILIARGDRPLPPAEIEKERAKAAKESHTADEERRRKNRELAHETLKAFDFRISGEDAEHWILEATPHPGYRPINRETAVLRHFRGQLWLSKTDLLWTRFDAEVLDTISFGLIIARLDKGAHLVIERTKINGEVWLPRRISGGGAGRIALLKKLSVQFETTCSQYRKFSSDSRLVAEPSAK